MAKRYVDQSFLHIEDMAKKINRKTVPAKEEGSTNRADQQRDEMTTEEGSTNCADQQTYGTTTEKGTRPSSIDTTEEGSSREDLESCTTKSGYDDVAQSSTGSEIKVKNIFFKKGYFHLQRVYC